jgi:hypothetical protein
MVIGCRDADRRTTSSVASLTATTEIALTDPPADGDPGGAISLGLSINYVIPRITETLIQVISN